MSEIHCKLPSMKGAEKFKLIENTSSVIKLESLNYELVYDKPSKKYNIVNKNTYKIETIEISSRIHDQILKFPIKTIQYSLF